MKLMIGEIIREAKEAPKIGKIKRMMIIKLYWERVWSHSSAKSAGRKPTRIFPPSKG